MIRTKKDLEFYLKEDMNQFSLSKWRYLAYLIYGFEHAYILRYIRLLRYCEYHYNCNHHIRFHYYNILRQHLGVKLHIDIPMNVCGYGLRIRHISGGGGHFTKCEENRELLLF